MLADELAIEGWGDIRAFYLVVERRAHLRCPAQLDRVNAPDDELASAFTSLSSPARIADVVTFGCFTNSRRRV
jgi:hypothetical protein